MCISPDLLENIHHQEGNDLALPGLKWLVGGRFKERFLGDTPVTIFINSLTIVAGILQIYSFIETRDDQKRSKTEVDPSELAEEWNSQLADLNYRLENIKYTLKQVNCRLDAVHATHKSISPQCLKFILPVIRQTSYGLNGKNYNNVTVAKSTSYPKKNLVYKKLHSQT